MLAHGRPPALLRVTETACGRADRAAGRPPGTPACGARAGRAGSSGDIGRRHTRYVDRVSSELESGTPVPRAGIARRSFVLGAAWSAPIIAVAVGAPAASASVTAPYAINLLSATVTIPPGYQNPGYAFLTLRNTGTDTLTTATIEVSGMTPGGFEMRTVNAGPGRPWSLISGSSDDSLVLMWVGAVEPGQSSGTLGLAATYAGSEAAPVTGTYTIVSVDRADVAPVSLTATTS
jgi:hypothetical protein